MTTKQTKSSFAGTTMTWQGKFPLLACGKDGKQIIVKEGGVIDNPDNLPEAILTAAIKEKQIAVSPKA